MSGPLAGIRVLEFLEVIAAPFDGMLLAEMGAGVIKVEPPRGEPWRLNFQLVPLESKTFIALNRGKNSLPLDLSKPHGLEIVRKLVPLTDVALVNYRPDVPAKLGVDYEALSRLNSHLTYCETAVFGRQGPDPAWPGPGLPPGPLHRDICWRPDKKYVYDVSRVRIAAHPGLVKDASEVA